MNRTGVSLFLITLTLSILGIFILYESSSYTALLHLSDRYYFIKNQSIWLFLGIILAIVTSRIKRSFLHTISLPLLVFSILLLLVVFLPGIGLELKGAHRWINFGFFVFQPSELLKVSLTLYLAAWLSVKEKGRLLAFLILMGTCGGLVLLQPDLSTTFIIVVMSVTVYFVSGASVKEMAMIFLIFAVLIGGLIGAKPYRVARLTSFQNFDHSQVSASSYHLNQIVIALGAGGLTGVGFGNSTQKYAYLPENTTDSIFAIFAEEAGFIGSLLLIGMYVLQMYLGIVIASRATDPFGKFLAAGITIFLAIQTFLNIASQAILIPLTGVPLPFISYGGSAMMINYISIGLLMNISRETHKTGRKK